MTIGDAAATAVGIILGMSVAWIIGMGFVILTMKVVDNLDLV